MKKRGNRLLALTLTVVMVLSFFSPAAYAVEGDSDEHSHDYEASQMLSSEVDPAYVSGTACYVQYDLNHDGVLSGKDAVELLGMVTAAAVYQNSPSQEYDFNEDGTIDTKDAVELLKIALWPEKYGYQGSVHAFSGAPVWQWNEDGTVVAVFRCACGQETPAYAATVFAPVGTEATCTEAGSVTTSASVEFLGNTYTNDKVTVSPATGHTFAAGTTCTEAAHCTKCDYVMPAPGHNYELTDTQEADCTHDATETYTCSVCGDSYTVKTGDKVHTYVYSGETLKDGETCVYVQVLKCSDCSDEIPGEEIERHEYKAAVTTEPTCQAPGVKTYTCTKCSDSYTETIPVDKDAGHDWQDMGNGNYECTICEATKTVVFATDENKVSADALENGGEVQLDNGCSVTLDEDAASGLFGELTLNVSQLTKEEKDAVNMDPDYKETSTIYSLTMTDGNGDPVTAFAGEVTVKLPYELQDGDDVDCIKVLYVDNEGTVEEINGHYSNGYVIFTTNHFSYYTVTRLTAAQRCELYGHNDTVTTVEATCENGGYTVSYCARCGRVEKSHLVAALGHDYVVTKTPATCTEDGGVTKQCSRCDSYVKYSYPATGHTWSTELVEATCTAPGAETKTCGKCGEKQVTVLPQKAHEISDAVVEATCTGQGYTTHTCANCDYCVVDSATQALGHSYAAEWEWDESNYSARITLTCATCGDTVTADAAVTEIVDPATCGVSGSEVFEARYNYAGQVYTNSITEELEALDHDFGPWEDKGDIHVRVCDRCGEQETAAHVWDEGQVTEEATCGADGAMLRTCLVCGAGYSVVLPATGIHNFENGVCTDCGFRVSECTHDQLHQVEQEIRYGDCVHTLRYDQCECGQCIDIYGLSSSEEGSWELIESGITQTDANTLETTVKYACSQCGLIAAYESVCASIDAETCEGSASTVYTVTGSDFETVTLTLQNTMTHLHTCLEERYDLAEYGFCGGTAMKLSCACGWSEILDVNLQCDASLEWSEEDEAWVRACAECGHKYVESGALGDGGDGCVREAFEDHRFLDENDAELLAIQTSSHVTVHQQPRYEFDMLGQSCEDGFYLTTYCDACGAVEKDSELYREHIPFDAPIDISGYDLCTDTIERYSCPCGEEQWVNIWDSGHNMGMDGFDETGTEYASCADCGLRLAMRSEVLSENGCYQTVARHYTLTLADGTELARWDETNEEGCHDFIALSITPLSDDGCLGMVEVTQRCTVCGFEETFTEDGSWTDNSGVVHHRTFRVEAVDLKERGLCGGELMIYECACGENHYMDQYDVVCQWEGVAGDENWWTDRCAVCGSEWKHTQDYPETDTCYVDGTEGLTITNGDGEEVFSREWSTRFECHDDTYDFELNGDTCAEGGRVIATCSKCGTVSEWEIWTGGHEWFDLERVTTPDNVCPGTITVRGCPCGAEGNIILDLSCNWTDVNTEWINDDEWVETGRCSECGASYERHGWDDVEVDGCKHTHRRVYTYLDADGQEFFSKEVMQYDVWHEFTYEVEMNGASCEDGYNVTETCKNCGEVNHFEGTSHYDIWIEQDPIDLAEHGFCGGILHTTGCPCGQEQSCWFESTENGCQWSYVDQTETENSDGGITRVYQASCPVCNATRTRTTVETFTGDESCEMFIIETTVYCSATGEEFSSRNNYYCTSHDEEWSYNLLGDSCEDGVECTGVCTRCNQVTQNYTTYGHDTRLAETVTTPENVCGGAITVRSCLCGAEGYVEDSCDCDHGWGNPIYEEPENPDSNEIGYSVTFRCAACGATKEIQTFYNVEVDGCRHTDRYVYTYRDQDGLEYFSTEFTRAEYRHSYVQTVQLYGETCDDGYTVTYTCTNCGDTWSWEGYGHDGVRTEQPINLAEHGFCGGIFCVSRCPCGQVAHNRYEDSGDGCIWSYDGQTVTQKSDGTGRIVVNEWHCEQCGATQTETGDTTYTDGCQAQVAVTTVYRSATGEEFIREQSYETTLHDLQATYTLLGESCTDGVHIQSVCQRCGALCEDRTVYEHETHRVEIIDLSGLPCGGYYEYDQCACGIVKYRASSQYCQWEYTGYDSDSQMDQYTCSVCGAHKSVNWQNTSTDSCHYTGQEHVILTDAQGNVVLDRVFEHADLCHEYVLLSAEAVDGDCENGYTAQLQCKQCLETVTETGIGHTNFGREIDLSEKGACSGTCLQSEVCACGQCNSVWVNMSGCDIKYNEGELQSNDDGTVTRTATWYCRDCGLRSEETLVGTREPGSCLIQGTINRVISLGGEVLSDTVFAYETAIHESFHYEYPEGVSCTDGIEFTCICDRCGEIQYTGSRTYHDTFVAEQKIDLSQYGAACGGSLTVYRCLCGAEQDIRLDSGDYCDFDLQACDLWIEDAVATHSRFNGEYCGWEYLESSAYDLICAVSDPEPCGFRIRVADYWKEVPGNPCLLQNVETWLIGYDPETDTCQEEISVMGRIVCDHDMTETNESTTNDQGQSVETTTWVCKDCGTTTTEECVYENGYLIKRTVNFNNALDNDDLDQSLVDVQEHAVHGTHSDQVRDYRSYVTQSGEEYWYEYNYEYDYDSCTVHVVSSNSSGYWSEWTDERHCMEYDYLDISEPTCTQFGEGQSGECMNCGRIETYLTSPTGHNWCYDSDTAMYYCSDCGLESAVGASGSIVIEDLTEGYGQDTNFVIGYWNRENIPVSYYVSAVLNDAPEGMDEDQVLSGISFTELEREIDGITAISFDQAEALRLAGERVDELGYTGSYDIRFAFVPQYGDTTLDYAITLTGVTA